MQLARGSQYPAEGIWETKGYSGLKYPRLGQAVLSVLTGSAHQHAVIYGEVYRILMAGQQPRSLKPLSLPEPGSLFPPSSPSRQSEMLYFSRLGLREVG